MAAALEMSRPVFSFFFFFFFLVSYYGGHDVAVASSIPAMYVFGDSLADVGNNNYLELSLLKADFAHNGIDYAGGKATGRFSNGKNAADFIAQKLGLQSPPPYLSQTSSTNKSAAFLGGLNFASGGAGIQDSTNSGQCLTFNKQIDYFSTVYGALVQQTGSSQVQTHLSKSIFVFTIGSNDIINYVKSSSSSQQFVDSIVSLLQGQLKRMYNLGARKMVFIGTGPIGCCPSQRNQNGTGDCSTEANTLSVQYNKGASSVLQHMKSELPDMSYSYFDTSSATLQYIQNPSSYGFTEVKAACCGLGNLNAKIACLPISSFCHDRTSYVFWDLFHPTEKTADMLTSIAMDGSAPFVFPINVKQLSTL